MPVFVRKQAARYPLRAFKADAVRALVALDRGNDELSILLCDDETIRALNREWRKKDSATDVLSFPMGRGILGDIVISVPTAMAQAEACGHSLDEEMRVLLVHGVLHLCGHDHELPGDDEKMAQAEAALLKKLGVASPSLVSRAFAHL